MTNPDALATIRFPSPAAWEAWLDAHHADAPGLWLQIAKAGSGVASVTYAEALEVALCYGWIDGLKASLDERFWLQKFTPRRARSGWSRVNREKVQELIAAGRMRPAGLRQVELAQADGRWDAAYASQSTIEVPPDLEAAFEAHPAARAFFATLNSANRYAVLYRIHTAKRPETRAKRVEQLVAMLERGEKLHP
jgi:uncharacterized protein YdeI (YjbR/CyaY-like superfamily)